MKNDILSEIVEQKRSIVDRAKKDLPLKKIQQKIIPGSFRMSQEFAKTDWGLIAECKLQSPSKGRLNSTHTVVELAEIFEDAGATMLSVHTDPHFLGSNESFLQVRQAVKITLLRKDFIIDEYQIFESRYLGADAILLIARIISPAQLKKFLFTAWQLGMDALIEVHDQADINVALSTPAQFIGINNRNLVNFTTSVQNTFDLLRYVDKKRTRISESGIDTVEDVAKLRSMGCNGILVGEGLVKAEDIFKQTRAFAMLPFLDLADRDRSEFYQ